MLGTRCVAGLFVVFQLLTVSAGAAQPDYPAPGLDSTEYGRSVWIENCEGCHAYGIAGSPNPMKPDDWAARVIKPRKLLYEHAINGFFGPDDTHMPPRGGNENLPNDDVKAAVDYMLEFALNQIRNQDK